MALRRFKVDSPLCVSDVRNCRAHVAPESSHPPARRVDRAGARTPRALRRGAAVFDRFDAIQRRPRALVVDGDEVRGASVSDLAAQVFGAEGVLWLRSLAELRSAPIEQVDVAICGSRFVDGGALDAFDAVSALECGAAVVLCLSRVEMGVGEIALTRGADDLVIIDGPGAGSLRVVIEKSAELSRMRRDNLRLQAALATSLAELRKKNRELEEQTTHLEALASTDPLTNLANRWRLHDRLTPMFSEARRYGTDLACLMIDLDDFKRVNDSQGHQAGDDLLAMIGRIINAQVRGSDIAARLGGDEFVVVMPHTSAHTAVALADRLMTLFRSHASDILRDGPACGMSIGIACSSVSAPQDARQLLAHADNALYAAKHAGKGAVRVCGADGVTAQSPELFAA